MPAHIPDELTTDLDKALWEHLGRVYEDYCGPLAELYPERTVKFVAVLEPMAVKLKESGQFKAAGQ